jgi:hypothetical protein
MQKQSQPEKDKTRQGGNPTKSDLRDKIPEVGDLVAEIDKVLEETEVKQIRQCGC